MLALSGTGAAAGLAGCFGGGSDTPEPGGTPRDPANLPPVHVFTDYNNKAWQNKWEDEIQQNFKEETGVKLNVEYAGFQGGSEQRLATLIQSGDPPDLYSSTFTTVADLWASGRLQQANQLNSEITTEVGEITAKPFEDAEGKTYMTPHGYYTSVLVYRQDVYDKLGLSVPKTFDELRANAKAIDQSDEVKARGMEVPGQKVGQSRELFLVLYANMGKSLFRWKSDAKEEAEVWFPKEPAIEVLNYIKDLAQYSPDPTSMSWGPALKAWAGGQLAQMYHVNAWAAGVAVGVSEQLGLSTKVAPLPLRGISKEESLLTEPAPDGWMRFKNGSNSPGAAALLKYLYGDSVDRTAHMYETEPMRFLPVYGDIIDSDAYTNLDYFQQYPEHLEENRKIQNEISANYLGNNPEKVPETGPTLYAGRFYYIAEMMNQVLAANIAPEEAYDEARQKAKQRLKEGKEKLG